MTDEEKLQRLHDALNEPDGAHGYSHAQIKAKIGELKDRAPASAQGLRPGEMSGFKSTVSPIGEAPPEVVAKRRGIMDRLGEGIETIGTGLGAIGEAITSPGEMTPERASQLARGVDDVTSLGYGQRLADAANRKLSEQRPNSVLHRDLTLDPDEMEREARFRTGGNIVGTLLPSGPASLMRKGIGAATRAMGTGSGIVSGMGRGALAAGAGYEVTAPILAAAHAESAGDRASAAEEAATDPLGLGLAVTAGGIGGGGRGKAVAIRDPRTESGRTLRDIEAAGGKTRMFGEPVKGGLYESAEMKGLAEGRAGTEQLAAGAEERMHRTTSEGVKATRRQYASDLDQVLSQNSKRPFLMQNAHTGLDRLEDEITVRRGQPGEMVADPTGTHRAIQQIRGLLTGPGGAAVVSGEDLLKIRKLASARAFAESDPAAGRVLSIILSDIDKDIAAGQKTVPGGRAVADMNRSYREGMSRATQANDVLYGKRRPEVERTAAARKTAEQRLMRVGDETVAGLTDKTSELGPEYQGEMTKIRAKKAQERIRRGDPQTSQPFERTIARAGWMRHLLGMLGLSVGGPRGFVAGEALGAMGENPLANQVRITLPVAKAAGKMTGGRVGLPDAILSAVERKRRKKQEQETRP